MKKKKKKKNDSKSKYDYLLSMPLWSLTLEKVEKLKKELQNKEIELQELMKTTTKSMWMKDLDDFVEALQEWYNEEEEIEQEGNKVKRVKGKRAGVKSKKVTKKQQDSDEEDYSKPIKKEKKEKEKNITKSTANKTSKETVQKNTLDQFLAIKNEESKEKKIAPKN